MAFASEPIRRFGRGPKDLNGEIAWRGFLLRGIKPRRRGSRTSLLSVAGLRGAGANLCPRRSICGGMIALIRTHSRDWHAR